MFIFLLRSTQRLFLTRGLDNATRTVPKGRARHSVRAAHAKYLIEFGRFALVGGAYGVTRPTTMTVLAEFGIWTFPGRNICSARMIGTVVNAAGILLGGLVGLIRRQPFSPATESLWKVTLGVFTVFYGLRLTWISLNGSLAQIFKQIVIVILALSLGRWTGWLLRLQRMSNRLGQTARDRINAATPETSKQSSDGFKVCALLFCAAPLGIVGAAVDGLSGYYYPLVVKAAIDGLAAMGLARLFGWSVVMAALPVLAFQGTITLVCAEWIAPFITRHGLLDSVNATSGLLIFSVALVILQLKKIALADYLPSLIYAALIRWLWP